MDRYLGIDVGGTGIKAGIVNTKTGEMITERLKVRTIQPATPMSVLNQIKELLEALNFNEESLGIGFPSVIKNGKTLTAANVHQEWIDFPIVNFFGDHLGKKVYVINDADAAGLAEYNFSDTIEKRGLTVFLTIGTGIGSALFYEGVLIPNSEFGHVHYKKSVAEKYVSNVARETKGLSWSKWGKELNIYLSHLDFILRPQRFILGGGVSKSFDSFSKYLTLETPVRAATLQNQAGVAGAAYAAKEKLIF